MSGGGRAGASAGTASPTPPWAWRVFVRIVVGLLRIVFRWRIRVRVEGDVQPGTLPAVLVANHTGNAEPFLVAYAVWRATGHWIQPLVKVEIFEMPVVGLLAPRAGAIPVARETAGGRGNAYSAAVDRLRAGGTVYLAPEGTITHDGRLLPLRHGAARLAIEADVPVIVVTTFGGQRAFSPVVRRPHLGALFDVVVEQLDLDPSEDAAALTGRIAATMIDRSEQLRAEYPQADHDAAWWPPYSEPAEPSRTARENLEQYRDTMAESVARARERMTALREEREVDERLRDARQRAATAAHHARERAQELADQVRARSDELVATARSGELGDQLRQRADELSARAEELALQARDFAEQLRTTPDDPPPDAPPPDRPPRGAAGTGEVPPADPVDAGAGSGDGSR